MIRTFILASLLAAAPALAQHTPSAEEVAATAIDPDKLIIHGKDLTPITVYQWERDGKLLHAWPGQGKDIPYDASKVDVRLYNFPTGQLRLIDFPRGTRTAWHVNESDIIFYSIDLHQVEFVGEQVFDSFPGDVSLHPAKVLHHSESITGGTKAEFAFGASGRSGDDLIAFSGRSQLRRDMVEWVGQGKRMTAPADGAAKGSAYWSKSFVFPGYRLVEAHYPAGSAIASHVNADEKLAFVVSGRLRVTSDTATAVLEKGDMVRMAAGKSFARTALSDTVVLEVDGGTAP